jgi:hypothetical protein
MPRCERACCSPKERGLLPRVVSGGIRMMAVRRTVMFGAGLCSLVFGVTSCSTTETSIPATTTPTHGVGSALPSVDRAVTPFGWVPVDYGDLQLSVPTTWGRITEGTESCGPWTGVVTLGSGEWCPPSMNTQQTEPPTVAIRTVDSPNVRDEGSPGHINGLAVYAPGLPGYFIVPKLHASLLLAGQVPPQLLKSLTYSPRAVVLTAGPSPTVPSDWRRISYGGIRFAVPKTWSVRHLAFAPPCASNIVLPVAGVVLTAEQAPPVGCPMVFGELNPVPQVAGVEVDDFQLPGASVPARSQCVGPAEVNGLMVCVNASPAYGELVAQVWSSGHLPVTVKIGLSGGGLTDRSVFYSMHRPD